MDKIRSAPLRKNVWITEIPEKLIKESNTTNDFSSKKFYKMT